MSRVFAVGRALLLAAATALPALTAGAEPVDDSRGLRAAVEVSSTPLVTPGVTAGALAVVPLGRSLEGALGARMSTVTSGGSVGSDGVHGRVTEVFAGITAEVVMPRLRTGVQIGLLGRLAAFRDGTMVPNSALSAGIMSAGLVHPFSVSIGTALLTVLPGVTAWFSIGPAGVSPRPDLLPILRLRLTL